MTLLCNGDIDRPIRIEVLDWDKAGKHAFMGQVDTSVRGLLDSNGTAMNVIDPRKQAKKGDRYLNDGVLHATYTYIEDNPTFADVSGWSLLGFCTFFLLVMVLNVSFVVSRML
jgi:hypothetical protein